MTGFNQKLLDYIRTWPGKDDDQIGQALGAIRNQVNQYARKLEVQGLVRRAVGNGGKIVNHPVGSFGNKLPAERIAVRHTATSVTPPSLSIATKETHDEEDWVKLAVQDWLQQLGWTVDVAWGRNRGIDIAATKSGERWIIECKGTGSSAPMQNNYFIGALGELLQRMTDPDARYSVAFTDTPKFRRLWNELPKHAKERLKLSAIFVDRDGVVNNAAV